MTESGNLWALPLPEPAARDATQADCCSASVALRRAGRALARFADSLVEAIATALLRRHLRRLLRQFDDRMLADIGLSRDGVEALVRGDPPSRPYDGTLWRHTV